MDVPGWFADALAAPVEHVRVPAGEVAVPVRAWGDPGAPGVVLVHGAAAHAGWWDHVGPPLARAAGCRVVALDLSGHGDADTRTDYSVDRWAEGVRAVAASPVAGRAPVVVGHSLGGMVGLAAAVVSGAMAGLVIVDAVVRPPDPRIERVRERRARAVARTFDSPEEAVARFRPFPDQECLGYVRDRVARAAVRPDGDRWTWKRDLRAFDRPSLYLEDLRPLACPLAVLRAAHGRLTDDDLAAMLPRLARPDAAVAVVDSGHHPMLDRPQALVGALTALLDGLRAAAG
ncbi:alpha/beta fold hydrolase [Pseudonocardia abyssalis]|uniref:Alpha/beta hydrolase n=1 Tax=Pseudonocardia abyssalis TaxID=2792008 RepID=A0ABS6USF2_9PSEU|nr:alpha/beta hydrolase [Pseudonocardia abyssalis]MBW0117648.1 alpha/beta hydrolase [Pseudonocardia abyssalis]MBW0134669.1 alpha/beta hydrolase [Pseudonocardia abyssalis]